jgi:hypothetical protein
MIARSLTALFPAALVAQGGAVLPFAAASPNIYNGNCPAKIEFVGRITTTVAGTKVDYRWERSNGDSGKLLHAVIGKPPAPGAPIDTSRATTTQSVPSDIWHLALPSQSGDFWEVLHIVSPFDIRSAHAKVSVNCKD